MFIAVTQSIFKLGPLLYNNDDNDDNDDERRKRGDMIQVWKTLHGKDDVKVSSWFTTVTQNPNTATTRYQNDKWNLV